MKVHMHLAATLLVLLFLPQADHQAEGIKALEANRFPEAVAAFERASAFMPGGVNSPVRQSWRQSWRARQFRMSRKLA